MKLSLKARLLVGFLSVIAMTSLYSTFVGIQLVRRSIVPRIQHKVSMDFAVAREILVSNIEGVESVVRMTSHRLFLQEALLSHDPVKAAAVLEDARRREGLDALTLVDTNGIVILRTRNPGAVGMSNAFASIISRVLDEKRVVSSVEVSSGAELANEARELAERARIRLVPTLHSSSVSDVVCDSGLVVLSAVPVEDETGRLLAVLYGFRLVNNSNLAEKMADRIYWGEKYGGVNVGAASIFLGGIRVATTVRGKDGKVALGTQVAEDVSRVVLLNGKKWTDRAFAVNDWYITAYEPLMNSDGTVIGMMGIGMLERRFKDPEYRAMFLFLTITVFEILFAILICLAFVKSVVRPLDLLMAATKRVAAGDYGPVVPTGGAPAEIEAMAEAFNAMAASIKERDAKLLMQTQQEVMRAERLAMIGRLAAGVAHEINNPLGSILLFTRLILQKAPREGTMHENLERIEKETKRCHGIVQGLLDFARPREPKTEKVDLNAVLDKTMLLFQNQPLCHNVEIVKLYDEHLPAISVDPSQIQQVFANIVLNAVDAMNGQGRIEIRTRLVEDGRMVEASFGDTGCGIPENVIDRIFEPFFTTKRVGQGTGLGLSISHSIVQRHGGTIRAESVVGRGSTFFVTFPAGGGTP